MGGSSVQLSTTRVDPDLPKPWVAQVHRDRAGRVTVIEVAIQTEADAYHPELLALLVSLKPMDS